MSRRATIAAAGTAFAILAAAIGFIYLKGGSTPLTLNDSVRRFRAQSITATAMPDVAPESAQTAGNEKQSTRVPSGTTPLTETVTGRPLPPPGVYEYATTGFDEVDVLGGSRHNYPSKTTVTVRRSSCGTVERWDVLKERWDERETCRTPRGDELHRLTTYHEFFRHGDLRTYRCEGFAYPKGAEPGDTWTSRCVSGSSVAEQSGRAVGWENLRIGTTVVRALHVRMDSRLSGEQTGASHRDVWGDEKTGLSLRERGVITSRSRQPVLGDVTYHEEFDIRLVSLEPKT